MESRLPLPAWIRRKRDGSALESAEIRELVRGYVDGRVPDYQMAAFAMAVFFRGMSAEETAALTRAMRDEGEVIPLGSYDGIAVDKHSTGGVGDKVSIALAPLVAACGLKVPMICGRGLGHTGGTIDKMEAIAGYRARLERDELVSIVRRVGAVIAGQSETMAPADRRLYALRDVTATVESIPLITASILSKKLAEGLDALVLDVKCGSGAFMETEAEARALARSLVDVGEAAGVPVASVLTRMDAPLGRTIGNALEVREAIDLLRGGGDDDLRSCTLALAREMLRVAGVQAHEAELRIERALGGGAALDVFRKIVEAQGGDPRVVDDPDRLPRAPTILEVASPRAGTIASIDARALGLAAMELGAGRRSVDDVIDPAVGLELHAPVGAAIARGEPLARIHARSPAEAEAIRTRVEAAFALAETAAHPAVVLDVVRESIPMARLSTGFD